MTSEEIRARVSASVSTTEDTIVLCEWLREIALQGALLNEKLQRFFTEPGNIHIHVDGPKGYGINTEELVAAAKRASERGTQIVDPNDF